MEDVDHQDEDQPALDENAVARLQELAIVLENASEQVGDLSIDLVRSAIEAGSSRPAADKTLARARRAIDKATVLLNGLQR